MSTPEVGIIMGSDSDLHIMKAAAQALEALEIPYELTVLSAHRTPNARRNTPNRLRHVAWM